MLRIRVVEPDQIQEYEHADGPVELGRGRARGVRRIVLRDSAVSRDHVRLEEIAAGWVRVENLSQTNYVQPSEGAAIDRGASRDVRVPVSLLVGHVRIDLEPGAPEQSEPGPLHTIASPVQFDTGQLPQASVKDLGEAPAPELLTRWLETVLTLQRSAVGATEVYQQTARALVELIGLDAGLVLLRREHGWAVVARYSTALPADEIQCSRTLVEHVAAQRRTFFQDLDATGGLSASLEAISAAVVSPFFGIRDEVVGLVYGVRQQGWSRGPIRPIEAQLVQLLAAAVGSHLARAAALRTRVQFEQFFSTELVQELENNPHLLEGREQEVTILVSDLRGYTRIAQKLGAQQGCRLVRDLMERLSQRINEQGGVIVDYAGDGLLAMWNAPVAQEDHVVRAARAALAMLDELPGLNADWQARIGEPLVLGIGLNTGVAQVGNIGSSRKFKYGPHGHTVNLASRVQDATKKFAVPILVTAATRERLPEAFATRALGSAQLPNCAEEVALHELTREGQAPSDRSHK
jgi:adenylate cyclase